jgi:AcrR family transcriptional regulator
MPRPRQVTNEAILSTVRECALERGAHVALDVIAERLGVTAPALLRRFGSREAIMLAALRPSDEPPWLHDLEAGPDERPLLEQLVSIFDRIVDYFEREAPMMSVLRESGIPIERCFDLKKTPNPVRFVWAIAGWLDRARRRGLVEGADFESDALAMLGGLHTRAFLNHFLPRSYWRRSRDQYVADLASLYARALTPAAARSQTLVAVPAPVQEIPVAAPRAAAASRSTSRSAPRVSKTHRGMK